MLEDVRPTLRNKPSGLKADWYSTMSRPSVSHQPSSTVYTRSSSSSSSSMLSTSPTVPQSPAQEFDHMSSLLAVSPPSFHGNSAPFVNDLFSLPRAYKDDRGRRQQPGLRDLPQWLRENFRNLYIRRIIEQVCLSNTPWNNPTLSSLQRELGQAYPTHRIRLHSDDAAVVPVSFSCFRSIEHQYSHKYSDPSRPWGSPKPNR